ncbi:heterokaryon incompatibility protein-domain-containing protein [Paraphoma chrysanthemicola]|nr:heterokaryon incompatibility protein-domain-containing protein [Paraphoma chrysanthemicola]
MASPLRDSVVLNNRVRSASLAGTSPETTQERLRRARERSSSSSSDSITLEETDKQAVTSLATPDNGATTNPASQGTAAEPIQFQHTPLDLSQNTIRVVEVLPLGTDGLVRCRVRHTTIESEYTCLSYVWGDADDSHTIHMNGQPFPRNLGWHNSAFSFEAATKALWIDALCIDQGNNNERNHQVQQMGSIFRQAQRVLAWTGRDHEYASLLRYLRVDMGKTRFFDAEYFLALDRFCKDKYWKRAWITQEVLLARQVLLVANNEAVDLAYFRGEISASVYRTFGAIIYEDLWERIIYLAEQNRDFTILENLHHLNWKECSDCLDVVYSLASISRDGPELQIEYNIGPLELACKVLRLLKQDLCLVHIKTVFSALGAIEALEWSKSAALPQSFVALEAHLWRADGKRCPNCDFEMDWDSLQKQYAPYMVFAHCLRCIESEVLSLDHYGRRLHKGKAPHLLIMYSQSDASAAQTMDPMHTSLYLLGPDNIVKELSVVPHSLTEGQTGTSLTVHLSIKGLSELIRVAEYEYTGHDWKQSHSTSADGSLDDTFRSWRLVE